MKLNRTGSNWTELERNKINENWDIIEGSHNKLEDEFDDVVGKITDEVVGHLIDSARLDWKEPVDTVEDLPANAEVGETRMVREADPDGISYVYRYDGENWEKIQAIDVTLVNEVDRRLSAQLAETADGVKPSYSVWKEFENRGANVDWYGAVGDGVTDDTQALKNAQILNDVIVLSQNKTYKIQNFVPRRGLTIIAYGAIIERLNDDEYEESGSSSMIINTNDDVRIIGGFWEGFSKKPYTGAICIESGTIDIKDAIINGGWAGIFGHKRQQGDKVAKHVSIQTSKIRNCVHNTWFADIENLVIHACHSTKSKGDGIRTYRNVKNISIGSCFIYDNGDSSSELSKDGIDLFIAGRRCVIINNFIYNNLTEGIDIKRYPDGDNLGILDEEYIISGNYIYNNKLNGFKVSAMDDSRGYIKNSTLSNNHIFENGDYGIKVEYFDIFQIHNNQVYKNGNSGIRVDNVMVGGELHHNIVYDNCRKVSSGARAGIHVTSSSLGVNVTHNKVYKGGNSQIEGIVYLSNGTCKDNDVSGHSTWNIQGSLNKDAYGDSKSSVIVNESTYITVEKNSALIGFSFIPQSLGSYTLVVRKRKPDGTHASNIFDGNLNVTEPHKEIKINLPESGSNYAFVPNNTLLIQLSKSGEESADGSIVKAVFLT